MNKSTLNQRHLSLFLIIASLLALGLWLKYGDLILSSRSINSLAFIGIKEHGSRLQTLWEDDIKKMRDKNLFHSKITSLNKIHLFLLDQNLHKHFDKLRAPFKFSKNGKNLLEISFMSHYSELDNTNKLIVQYNLIDKHSREMFWEYSRTITLPKNILN